MDAPHFAREFGWLYRELYWLAVRRIDDARDAPSSETIALLLHLSQAGPMTLSELARHLGRALSTLSAKVAALEADGLLARQRDDDDARRALIWLSPTGRDALTRALEVLDASRLAVAAGRLDEAQRQQIIDGLHALVAALPPPKPTPTRGGST